jgi:hypothetical protein
MYQYRQRTGRNASGCRMINAPVLRLAQQTWHKADKGVHLMNLPLIADELDLLQALVDLD